MLLAIDIPFATLIPTRSELNPPGPAAMQMPSSSFSTISDCASMDDIAGINSAV